MTQSQRQVIKLKTNTLVEINSPTVCTACTTCSSCGPNSCGNCSSHCNSGSEHQTWTLADTDRVLNHVIPERVLRKATKEGHFNNLDEARVAGQEWLKYVALCCSSSAPLGMISKKVDEIWHAYILFSREYFAFSKDIARVEYFHHAPTVEQEDGGSDMPKNATANFIQQYRDAFGKLPEIWGHKNFNDCTASCSTGCGSTCSPGSGCGHGGCY